MAKDWTPEERKAFAEKMKASREAKKAEASTTPNTPPQTNSNHVPTASEQQDQAFAEKMAQLDEALRKTNELNAKLEKQEQERTEAFSSGMKGMSTQEQAAVRESHQGKAAKMKEHLSKQDKVSIFVPLEGKEKMGTQLPVTLNGYRVNIPKGRYVSVPKQVAEIVMDSLNQTQEALDNEFLIDNDEKKQTALQ